jgi:hypothetical protein
MVIILPYYFISCEEDKYFDIDKNAWILLEENDTLLFHSINNTDTFYISNIGTYYEDIDKTNYYQHLDIDYEKIHNGTVDISLLYNIHRTYKSAIIEWDNYSSGSFYSSVIPMDFTIDLKIFVNVYKVDNYFESELSTDVRTLYYTDKYGIIAYELYNGELFEIDIDYLP